MSLIDAMHKRWSPRSFLPKDVEEDKLKSLLEAARWAPSSMNEQPWRYYYATKENADAFNRLVACLVPVITLGYQGQANQLPDALKERELAPRIRLEFDDIVNHLKE